MIMAFKKFSTVSGDALGENANQSYPMMVANTMYAAIPHHWGPDLGKTRRNRDRGSNLVMQVVTPASSDLNRDEKTVAIATDPIFMELPNQAAKLLGIVSAADISRSNGKDEVFVFRTKTQHIHIDADEAAGTKVVDFDTVTLDDGYQVYKEA